MSYFAFVLLAVQACLLQNAYSQCIGAGWPAAAIGAPCGCGAEVVGPLGLGLAGPLGLGIGPAGLGLGIAGPVGLDLAGPIGACWAGPAYGGAGIGEVAVAGELPAAGATVVAGQVPVLGGVEFGGIVPAAGTVSIGGSCACGCAGPLLI